MTREEAIEVIEQDIPCEHDTDFIEALKMAISALKQTEDAISRQAAISNIKEMAEYHTGDAFNADRVIQHLKGLPSVQPKQIGWISVKERLPEKNGRYLVTLSITKYEPIVEILSYAKDLYKANRFDFRDMKGQSGWYEYSSEYGDCLADGVLAWQELTEPYEPQESEE